MVPCCPICKHPHRHIAVGSGNTFERHPACNLRRTYLVHVTEVVSAGSRIPEPRGTAENTTRLVVGR